MSSTHDWGGGAGWFLYSSYCFDGNLDSGCHTATSVDGSLGSLTMIITNTSLDTIKVYNRRDCCGGRIRNATITLTIGQQKAWSGVFEDNLPLYVFRPHSSPKPTPEPTSKLVQPTVKPTTRKTSPSKKPTTKRNRSKKPTKKKHYVYMTHSPSRKPTTKPPPPPTTTTKTTSTTTTTTQQ